MANLSPIAVASACSAATHFSWQISRGCETLPVPTAAGGLVTPATEGGGTGWRPHVIPSKAIKRIEVDLMGPRLPRHEYASRKSWNQGMRVEDAPACRSLTLPGGSSLDPRDASLRGVLLELQRVVARDDAIDGAGQLDHALLGPDVGGPVGVRERGAGLV